MNSNKVHLDALKHLEAKNDLHTAFYADELNQLWLLKRKSCYSEALMFD